MNTMPTPPENVLNLIRECRRAVVCGHCAPDGDCAYSIASVSLLLKAMGKECFPVNDGPFFRPEIKFVEDLLAKELPEDIFSEGTIGIVVDCSTPDRLGTKAEIFKKLKTVVVDHHSSGEDFGDARYVVPQSISTTLLVYNLFKALEVPVSKLAAQYIFRGFATDSGFFKFLHAQSGPTLRLVSELADCGVVPNDEYHVINGGKSLESVLFLGELINRIESFYDGRVLISHEEKSDFTRFGDNASASDELYANLTCVKGVQVVLFFKISKRVENAVEVGIRANHSSSFDAGAFASLFSGGGHAKAAGLTLKGSYEEVKEKILTGILKYLD